jgi:RNA polymerase primary sigma factor
MSGAADRTSDADALQAYLRAIARIPRLTPEEERSLGRRIQESGDEEALRRLVEGNLRFVVSYAKRFRGLGVAFLDLIHEGNLGVMEAARRFDPDRNVKFITYAVWWIRQAVTHALAMQSRVMSLPQRLSGAASKLGREVAELTEELDRAPTPREIAEDMDISEADVNALLYLGGPELSLSDRVGRGHGEFDGAELAELLEQDAVPPVDEAILHEAIANRVRVALGELDEKEREVVELRFGLDRDGDPRTLQEVGDILELSRERIRQIESRAKEKLRRSKRAGELRSYLN